VPELRIVEDSLWEAVRSRQAELARQFEATTSGLREARARKMNELRRPVFLLSGLLECGRCGGKYGIVVNDRYGCLNRYRRGTCDNGHTIRRDVIERRALAGISEKLVSAEAVREAVAAYVEQTNLENRERRAQADLDRRTLDKIERSMAGLMAAIEDGMYQPAMKARMADIERQKAEILSRLADTPADAPDIHPNIAEIYRRKVERFSMILDDPELRPEVANEIRSLVARIVLVPGEKRGEVLATLCGELVGIMDFVRDESSPPGRHITYAAVRPRNQHS
jgi:hypothetical protein